MNGSACSQNSKLINGILKDELGFQGFVVSDWLAQIGGVSSALAGLDMAMPGDGAIPLVGSSYWGSELSTSILNGTVPVDRLNDMVRLPKAASDTWALSFFSFKGQRGIENREKISCFFILQRHKHQS